MFSIKRIVIATFIICIIINTQISYSAVPKDVTPEAEINKMKAEQDSLYAIINKGFQKIKPMLEYSCYDCHSTQTKEPWYFNIPGVSSFIKSHIDEGLEHLDFTNGFPFKTKESLLEILHEMKEEVEEGEMPLLSYRIMHWGRLIEGEQQDSLFQWIEKSEATLKAFCDRYSIPYNTEKSLHDEKEDTE